MSEKHLYEKHLAEKLQQLSPPPGMEQHWHEMKAMLDDDRPRGGGYGKRWWRIGVLAGTLLIGGWITGTFLWTDGPEKQLVTDRPNSANVEQKKLSPGNNTPEADDQVADNGKGAATPDNTGEPGTQGPANGTLSSTKVPVKSKTVTAIPDSITDGFSATVRSLAPGTGSANKIADKSSAKSPPRSLAATTGAANKNRGKVQYGADVGDYDKITQNNPGRKNDNQYNTKDDITVHSNNKTKEAKPVEYSPLRENINYTGSIVLSPGDNLKKDFSSLSIKTKESLKTRSTRAGKRRQDRSFAFGLSLPLAFPLGDQKALSYNFNAGANTVSDYIPAPHVQYRLSKNTYLQTELQFIAPQYIRPILLYEQRSQAAGNYMVYNSVYARKLYYFNLPVGIHHSPFQNFYLGTGLQFSSLLSGVGLYEETKRTMNGQPVSLLNEHYARLGGDSLSNRMNRAEVRLMLEANYYFNRFTFGLRYNQAFNNYVNFRLDNMSPYTFDKNKALQFYLRYNLWEDVRRRNGGKGMLSSK